MQSNADDDVELALDIVKVYSVKVPALVHGQAEASKAAGTAARAKEPSVSAVHYDPLRERLYYGLDSGVLCFWLITKVAAGTPRFVGSHKGAITAICTPGVNDGDLGRCQLIITGSVDATVKLWDFKGKVNFDPAACVQTLYGHSGSVTALVIKGGYILSSSTDKTIRVWRSGPGRGQLVYPWLELQVLPHQLP